MTRVLRRALAALVALLLAGGGVMALPAASGAASPVAAATPGSAHGKTKHTKKKKKPARPPKPVTLAPGAVVRYYDVTIGPKHVVRTALLRLDVRHPGLRLGAAIGGNAIGGGRQTVAGLTRANGGVGGINGDFFKAGQPLGGLIVNGVVLKTPRPGWDANFYLRGGRARIGPVTFTGTVTRAARSGDPVDPAPPPGPDAPTGPPTTTLPAPPTTRPLASINAVRDLSANRLVLVTSSLAQPRFGRSCTVAFASRATNRAGSSHAVTAVVSGVRSIPRRVGSDVALVACGSGSRPQWLRSALGAGDALTIATSLSGGTPQTLVSGGQVLVRHGRAFRDTDGKTITGRNPESFGCVSRSGASVVLGTVDGRREGSSGVTLPELTRYLLQLRCWSGIVFDGGGSATLVGRPAGTTAVRVLNRPSDRGGARAVTSGLLLYRR